MTCGSAIPAFGFLWMWERNKCVFQLSNSCLLNAAAHLTLININSFFFTLFPHHKYSSQVGITAYLMIIFSARPKPLRFYGY